MIVGGGPTGVEVAGSLGDMVQVTVPSEYRNIDSTKARICLLDFGDALLKPFSDKAHGYVAKVLEEKGVEIHLGTGVKEVGTGHAVFSDGTSRRHPLRGLGRWNQGGRGGCRLRPRPGARAGGSTSNPT